MEFWGVEVKPGESLPVCPEENQLIHISQVALGEVKNVKAANYVPVRLTVDGKKFVIGTLSAERGPQITFDLVLQKEFELSHDWKDGSIYFCGYTAEEQEDEGPLGHGFSDEEGEEETSDEEEEELQNAKPVSAPQAPKPANAKAAVKPSDSKAAPKPKPKVTLVDPKDDLDESDDLDDDESDDLDDLEDDSDDDMSEDETPQKTTPEKAKASKKRPSEPEAKTPVSTKKSKTETPQKTDGKKGSVHTATPHPAKKSEKKTVETPKSSAQVCKTCSKTFTSEKGLESHSKAKHGGK